MDCREEFGAPKQKSRITANIRAYVVYLMMELRLSNTKIAEHLQEIYGISLTSSMVHAVKSDMANKLNPVYRRIIERLRGSPVVYVDETKGVVYGGGHYVWVFASSDSTSFNFAVLIGTEAGCRHIPTVQAGAWSVSAAQRAARP